MNINDYNRCRHARPNSPAAKNSRRRGKPPVRGKRKRRKRRKNIRWDRLIGYVTVIAIVLLGCMIYSDIKKSAQNTDDEDIVATEKVIAKNGQRANTGGKYDKKIILIDAGHGGSDVGAQFGNILEKNQTLEMAKLVQKELEGKPVQVIMSRTSDKHLSLEDRLKAAQSKNAGILVSIHRNFYEGQSDVEGVEAWINSSQPSDSKTLAEDILYQLTKAVGFKNRGVKSGTMDNSKTNYYLNTDKSMTSCIVELGFMTAPGDNKKMTQNKTACAKAIAQGIMNYINEVEKN